MTEGKIVGQNVMEKYLRGIMWLNWGLKKKEKKKERMNLKSRMLQKIEERKSGYWLRGYGENWIFINVIFIRQ